MHVMHAAIVSYCRVLYSCKRATTIFLTVAQINRAETLITAWPIFNLKYDLHEANLMGQSNTQCGYSETDARCSFCQNLGGGLGHQRRREVGEGGVEERGVGGGVGGVEE